MVVASGGMVLAAMLAGCGDSDDLVVGDEPSSWEVQRLGEGGLDAGAALAEANGVVVAATSTMSGDLLTWRSVDGGEMEGPTTSPGADRVAFRAVAGGPQGFVAVAHEWALTTAVGPVVWRSDDGTTWEPVGDDLGDLAGRTEVADVVATPDGFVAVGTELLGAGEGLGSPRAWSSEDGTAWTAVDLGSTDRYAGSIVAEGDVLHALGEHTAWRSEDGGRTWQASSIRTDTFDISFGVSGLALVDGVLLTSTRGELEGGDAQEVLLESLDSGRTWEADDDLAASLAGPLGAAALFGGGEAPVWLLASGHVDPFSDPDLCYSDPSACGIGDPIVLETTDAVAWRAIDLAAAAGGAPFDVADVLQTAAGDTVVLAVDDGLVTWTWPASAGGLPEAEAEPPPEGSDLPVASEEVPLEEGMTYRYPKDTHCGIDELGIFNGQVWHAEGTSGEDPFTGEVELPGDVADGGGSILGYLTLVDEDTIEYSIEPDGEPIATYRPEPLSELWGCM
jgi:hypothetical protein